MPEKFLNKVKYLCKLISKEEWSGVLFYSIQGTIKDVSKMIITVEDILPLDKGSSAYTEYSLDDRLIDYMMENPESQDYKIGHIHSHNTMSVFFSGTDMEELTENSFAHNFYLSLIVNNDMDFTAKVGFVGKSEVSYELSRTKIISVDENGESYTLKRAEKIETKEIEEKVYVYDCEIDSPIKNIDPEDEDFKKRVQDIIDKSKVTYRSWDNEKMAWVEKVGQSVPVNYNKPSNPGNNFGNSLNLDLADHFNDDEVPLNPSHQNDEFESMMISLFKASNPPIKGESLEYIICQYELTLNSFQLKERFTTYLSQMYLKYIPSADEEDNELFKDVVEEMIEVLQAYELSYGYLSTTIAFLKELELTLDTVEKSKTKKKKSKKNDKQQIQ